MLVERNERRNSSGVFRKCSFGFLLSFFLLSAVVDAQNPPIVRANGEILPFPWLGGLNACHFAPIDLNGDGKNDYIVFDRIGERLLCFSSEWEPLPDLEQHLPPLRSWVQAHDYNQDGRMDLFTFNGISGICVYKNLSEKTVAGYRLQFELVSKGLPAEMFGSFSPLYCTGADYPVIADMDGDGDLDVLNFWVPSTGDFLLYYRNFAVENLHRADTFLLQTEDWSWGCFVENEESNAIILDSCRNRNEAKAKNVAKHAGSTMFAVKNETSGLYDLVLGDMGYPGLLFLHNGGSAQKARITSYDTVFPLSTPVVLPHFPVLSPIVKDGRVCYVFSPFETNPFSVQGAHSLWLYEDTGGGAAHAKLLRKDFLQNQMLDFGSGAVPVAFDYNHDGKTDLVVGNYGSEDYPGKSASLALLENIGNEKNPAFELKTTDYLGLSRHRLRALHPAFADMDQDGADEMVLGMEDGRLWLLRLRNNNTETELCDSLFLSADFSGFSAPTLFDLNQDGLLDVIVGEKQHTWPASPRRITKGSLTFFQNTGKKENGFPVFEKMTDSLGGVDVIARDYSNFGYSRPSFYLNHEGEILLACGSENGEVYLYDRIAGNLQGNFRCLGRAAIGERILQSGIHAAPLLHDFDGDGKPELLIGNQCGGLRYFFGTQWQGAQAAEVEKRPLTNRAADNVFPNPVKNGFYVRVMRAERYRLCDFQGRVLKRFSWQEGLHHVDMSRCPAGLYFLQSESSQTTQKIIKH